MNFNLQIPFQITVAYLAVVFAGQKIMEKCRALDGKLMDYILALWNLAFSVFSGIAAYKLLPELFYSIRTTGIVSFSRDLTYFVSQFKVGSYCNNLDYYTDPTTGYWGWMFVMSKAPELGDTLFLVLRKRPVIFMHW
jgi:elongation of very long chain fatty acids protein 6